MAAAAKEGQTPAEKSTAENRAIKESCLYCGDEGTRGRMIYNDELDSWFCPYGCEALYHDFGSPENE